MESENIGISSNISMIDLMSFISGIFTSLLTIIPVIILLPKGNKALQPIKFLLSLSVCSYL